MVCFGFIIAQGKYQEAEVSLQDALDKDPNSADALINLFMNSHFVGKAPEVWRKKLAFLLFFNDHKL